MSCLIEGCDRKPLDHSKSEGKCILHATVEDKDLKALRIAIREAIEEAKRQGIKCDFSYCYFPAKLTKLDPELFEGVVFPVSVTFKGAKFQGRVSFAKARFQKGVIFRETEFKKSVDFSDAEFKVNAEFTGTKFQGRAAFIRTKFQGDAFFLGVKFQEDVNFADTEFYEVVFFGGTEFQKRGDFEYANFQRTVSFRGAVFSDLKDKEVAYRKARRCFEREGDREEADYYFYHEMVARRKQRSKLWQWPLRSLEWLLVDRTCAYGTRYDRVILFAIVLILGFAFLVVFAGDLYLVTANVKASTLPFLQKLLYSTYFSVVTFTTLGYGDIHPIGWLTRGVASLESFIGAFMMALFVAVFVRKYMR